ncbi:ATP synthase subunit I [Azospirillum thermophilum]|uniref:N-ATPase subunit AtpR n=1 Tax=Azospirillum thermophilum TaxID=2202148 RepID=UPI00143D255F|nr:ATP synthase subunit I [Azospirillum thermophilum]
MTAHLPLLLALFLAGALGGALLAVAFFRGLALELRLVTGGAALRGVALHVARFALAAGVLAAAALQGAAALLGALAGFELARRVLLARAARGEPGRLP